MPDPHKNLSPNQHHQNNEGNPKHWLQPAKLSHQASSFVIHQLSAAETAIGCLPLLPKPLAYTHTSDTTILQPFSGTTRLSRCQKKSSSGLYGTGEDIRGRHTNNPAGCYSIRTNQRPTSLFPHFYARCPSCRYPPNLSWLGTGTKYVGLHTQWRGYPNHQQWLSNAKLITVNCLALAIIHN